MTLDRIRLMPIRPDINGDEEQPAIRNLIETQTGPRKEILKIERDLVERMPGPQNRERWAGKRLGE